MLIKRVPLLLNGKLFTRERFKRGDIMNSLFDLNASHETKRNESLNDFKDNKLSKSNCENIEKKRLDIKES